MTFLTALVTSKTAIALTLVVAAYQTMFAAPPFVLILAWSAFAGTVLGRAVRQYREL